MRKFLICLLTATYLLSGCSNHSITGPGMPTDKTSQFHEAIERVAESLATAESSQSQERISTFTTWNGQETVPVILSILVDTFSSRILNPMLLPSGKRNIVVF